MDLIFIIDLFPILSILYLLCIQLSHWLMSFFVLSEFLFSFFLQLTFFLQRLFYFSMATVVNVLFILDNLIPSMTLLLLLISQWHFWTLFTFKKAIIVSLQGWLVSLNVLRTKVSIKVLTICFPEDLLLVLHGEAPKDEIR